MTPTTPATNGFDTIRRRARRAYELGRLRFGVMRGLALAAVVGFVVLARGNAAGLAWLPVTAAVWAALEWRGGALLRGARVGAWGGLVTLALPLSAFRTCCRAGEAMMGPDCCSMTGACATVGGVVGLVLALFLVHVPPRRRLESAAGMGLALVAVASVRCADLLAGEAVGLLGGLVCGAVASSLVAAVVDRRRHAPGTE